MLSAPPDRERVEDLYRAFGGLIYARCLKLLKDRERARDATQDVFLKLLRDGRLEGRGEKPLPWIYQVATCHCLDLLRAQSRRTGGEGGVLTWERDPSVTTPAEFAERQLAHQVLARFDVKTQAIAVGILVDGMDQVELAEALGMTRQTVARRLERFLENARKFAARSTT